MKAGLVLTSINVPECLEGYRQNFEKYGHLNDVEVFMISDMKTPGKVFDYCDQLFKQGLNVNCYGVMEQEKFVQKLGLHPDMFPRNTDHRRNIGYLMALDKQVDWVISIDDDNYCREDKDFFVEHARALSIAPKCLSLPCGWLNPCDWLDTESKLVYQRGYPYYMRHADEGNMREEAGAFAVHVNEGLWLSEPDLDALAWLVTPVRATKHSLSVVVAKDTWAPINSQNTAVRAEAMPAYYFVPMNLPVFDRFGDIFQGYFLQACMKHLGGHLRIGTPIVEHRRNSHNYFEDVKRELPCIEILEDFLPWLTSECKLSGSDYCETYECLSERLLEWSSTGFFLRMASDMKEWVKACRTIGVGKAAAA